MAGIASTWWWYNRVNGSPFYSTVASSVIDAGLSSPGATLASFGAGQTIVLDLTATILPDANGELGIYNTNSFGSASAIEDYVLWGAKGIRDIVAENAGIWTDNDSIDVSGILPGETLLVLPGTEGNASTEWTTGTGTLGTANVPEPASAAIATLGLTALLRRKR